MSVGVTGEKQDLEEKHAGGPDARAAAEPGQDVFADERLNLEKEEGAEKDGEGVGDQGARLQVTGLQSCRWQEVSYRVTKLQGRKAPNSKLNIGRSSEVSNL